MRGSCLCGDVAFDIDRSPSPLAHCHCSICRKLHGNRLRELRHGARERLPLANGLWFEIGDSAPQYDEYPPA